MDNFNDIGSISNSYDVVVPQVAGAACASFAQNLEGNRDTNVDVGNHVQDVRSPDNNGQIWWIDDYKCTICGAEVPAIFVDERQEHIDFHIAEKLQEEESGIRSRTLPPRKR